MFVSHFFSRKRFVVVVLERFFSFKGQKKWSLVTLDFVVEFAWADSALVVLDEWSFYRGGLWAGLTVLPDSL